MEALDAEVGPGVPYPKILVEVRERARSEGLWNLFMPDERYGPGLAELGVRAALRGDGAQPGGGADGLQLRGTGHRQHGDPRRARQRGAARALA